MNQRQSWKWDAEAAFKRIESDSKIYAQEPGQGERASRFLYGKRPHKAGWTPAPDPRAYMKAKPDVYKGRDYEALTKAALRKPVGYWEDAPRGIKFGGGGEKARLANAPVPVSQMSHAAAPSAPTTPPPAAKKPPVGYWEDAPHGIKFGGQPLPSATTNPHGKDVDTADGPWPKCACASAEKNRWHSGEIVAVYEDADDGGTCYFDNGHVQCCSQSYERNISTGGFVPIALANAIPKLEQNGHEDAAAQLRGKAAADDLYEPVGTMPVVGDTIRKCVNNHGGAPVGFNGKVRSIGGKVSRWADAGDYGPAFGDFESGVWRILKRKSTVQTVAGRSPLHA